MTSRRRFLSLSAVAGGAGLATVAAPALAAPLKHRTYVRPAAVTLQPKMPTLIFGDSYVQGVGADKVTNGWAYKVGSPLNLSVTVNGAGGSGYCNPTTYNAGVYYDRLTKVAKPEQYQLVVLQGSSNDDKSVTAADGTTSYVWDDATLSAAIAKALDLARTLFPAAQLVMLGATNPYGNGGGTRANGLLTTQAKAYNIPFINPLTEKWFVPGDGSLFANTSNGHPNNAGHAMIRSAFVRDMQVLSGS